MRAVRPLVLCYHAVSATWASPLAVSPALLERQLSHLAARGYVGMTISEAERHRLARTLPRRVVVVTFDDAFASVLDGAEVLARVGFPGTVFALGAYGDGQVLDWPEVARWHATPYRAELRSLTWDELRGLHDRGWEIGAHSLTHPSLPTLDDETLATELAGSLERIADEIGTCTSLAYPFGRHDARVVAAARAAGFSVACTLSGSHPVDAPLQRPRVGLYATDDGWRLRAKVAPASLALRRSPLVHALERHVRGVRAPGKAGSLL